MQMRAWFWGDTNKGPVSLGHHTQIRTQTVMQLTSLRKIMTA